MKKEDPITTTVAANVALARKAKKWTQQDLAEAVGCSKQAIMTYETCRNEIANEVLLKIAEATGKNWLWFYQDQALTVGSTVAPTASNQAPAKLTPEEQQRWALFNRFLEFERSAVGGAGAGSGSAGSGSAEDCFRVLNEVGLPPLPRLFIEQQQARLARSPQKQPA